MIFITVGTHEQPFNRLLEYIDDLKRKEIIMEKVLIQTGYSTYEPRYCEWSKLFPYSEMKDYVAKARIVITHGGPSSFIMPLQIGKIPIVVPRRSEFGEHVNNHQVDFCKAVAERMKNIIVVDDVEELENLILNYNEICSKMDGGLSSNNEFFNAKFKQMIQELFEDKGVRT